MPKASGTPTTSAIRFQFYSLKFTPYNDVKKSSNDILVDVLTYLQQELHGGKGHLIDRHHNRVNENPRELFMTHSAFMLREKRVKCSLALLRSGRMPMLKPADKFLLVPLDQTQGSIAEQTHFFIDYNRTHAVICCEFNYHGPRISDIEFYLRSVAHEKLRLAKATEVTVFMNDSIDKTLAELKNVLNIEIKVKPAKLAHIDTDLHGQYLTAMSNFGQKLKPKFIRLEAFYQSPGNAVRGKEINKEAVGMVKSFLQRFKTNPSNIGSFEDFVVKYEDADGKEELFNLLKGKREIIKDVDLSSLSNDRSWYELVEEDINEFMNNH